MTDAVTGNASRRRRKEARPQELTAAALALFVEKGFAATRLDEIAARAGVSKGTLYLYFDSKEALFKAVIQEGVVPAIEAGEALLDAHDDPVVLLRAILLGWWERIGNTELGGIPKLMMSEARNFPEVAVFYDQAVIQRGLGLVRAAISRGIARGVFRAVDLDTIGPVLIAPLLHLALWRHSYASCCGRDTNVERYLQTCLDVTLNGLLRTPPNSGDIQ
ncbi:TetR/AcrR family transcriptional regulator [Aromatoleum diolicum]|uniref:TetR family transcriptional regulator n=1 Tax=Aromatoleum diolicum TaxID=75796 RepID=A0ABX1Q921_9RHOO|nr:TetR/AcrR family transcriptional regulator [Aromatoleum diolicum]NMG73921.1 TetR family transcriptional regulator [Aromatoleum diolicum]